MKHLKSVWSICLALTAPSATAALLLAVTAPLAAQAAPADDPAATADDPSTAATSGEAAASPETADDETPPAPPPPVTPPPEAAPTDPAATTLASPSTVAEGEADEESVASEDESQAAEAQAAAEPLAWRNSFFTYSVAATFNSFCRDCQLSYNPNVYQFFSFTPRWYLDASTFFALSLGAFYEFTDDDSSAYNHEFQLGDMSIELRRTVPWEGFIFIPAARLTFPTSKASQGAQRFVNGALGVTVVRPIPEAAGMTIAGVFRYQRWFADSNVVEARGQCVTATRGGDTELAAQPNSFGGCDGLAATEADRIVAGLSINITPVERFTVSLSAFYLWSHVHELADGSVPIGGGSYTPMRASDATRWRAFTSYSLSIAYDVVEWLNLSLSVSNATNVAPFFNDDGSVRSPFNPDTQISLSATFTLDAIYNALSSSGEDDGLTPEERQRRRQGLASRGSTPSTL